MLSKRELRNAHIAIAIGTAVAFIGGFLARDSGEGAMQLVGIATFVAAFGIAFWLIAREERREREKRDQ